MGRMGGKEGRASGEGEPGEGAAAQSTTGSTTKTTRLTQRSHTTRKRPPRPVPHQALHDLLIQEAIPSLRAAGRERPREAVRDSGSSKVFPAATPLPRRPDCLCALSLHPQPTGCSASQVTEAFWDAGLRGQHHHHHHHPRAPGANTPLPPPPPLAMPPAHSMIPVRRETTAKKMSSVI